MVLHYPQNVISLLENLMGTNISALYVDKISIFLKQLKLTDATKFYFKTAQIIAVSNSLPSKTPSSFKP